MQITMQAHAKINWALNVLSRREDGYHELDMLMQPLTLCDELRFESARWLTLTIDGQHLPVGGRNLIIRAANALNEASGYRMGARIHLKKRIPVRAGMGGGSADCAAALLALNRLWGLHLPLSKLMEIGMTLGADVPFCLQGGFARVSGLGEAVVPLPGAPHAALAMVRPGDGLATADVFRAWDAGGFAPLKADAAALAQALSAGDWARAQTLSFNALEAPAIRMMPLIGETMGRMTALGARYVRMTGSGSTVYGVFDTDAQAAAAAAAIPGAFATRTLSE